MQLIESKIRPSGMGRKVIYHQNADIVGAMPTKINAPITFTTDGGKTTREAVFLGGNEKEGIRVSLRSKPVKGVEQTETQAVKKNSVSSAERGLGSKAKKGNSRKQK